MTDPLLEGYLSLSTNVNKAALGYLPETEEGVVGDLIDELKLSMTDDELLDLKDQWEKDWAPYEKALAISQMENENYWIGKQYTGGTDHAPIDNLIFEAVETFLPLATRPTADPVVTGDNTDTGNALADKVRLLIQSWANDQSFNLELKQVARFWLLFKLGCMKVAWSKKLNDVTVTPIRPQKLILDPDATIKSGKYTGEYIGEYKKDTAQYLIKRFPGAASIINEQCKGKLGTKLQYVEWWTDDYVFWTMEKNVLAKAKNPNWNYESNQKQVDSMGVESSRTIEGRNHLPFAQKPYAFLSIFSLGLHPYDETNLIQQNIPLQDLINKRLRQIDKNADRTNGALAVSGDAFTKDQAALAGKAVEKGGTIYVPNGNVNNAVARIASPALPNFIYESLIDYRNELRNTFGTRGSSAEGTIQDRTVRGKLQIKGQDSDRIGGGISTYLEQFSDVIYNLFVQMVYVYYDKEHIAKVIGKNRTMEYFSIKSSDMVCKLSVSVKDGSMIPKDPVTEHNESMDLWSQGALDPITLFEKLDFPDPKESAEQLFKWKSDPASLFPDLQSQQQQSQQGPPKKVPSETLNYKDAPEDIKRQIEAQAGLQPSQQTELSPQQQEIAKLGLQQNHEHLTQQAQHLHENKKLLASQAVPPSSGGQPNPIQ